ncbi:MAG TPA: hypothetical protein VMZ50_01695 [Phycisphaerae bacterium]|nr:hypothetical protein [Phycisphaerae bacterium]
MREADERRRLEARIRWLDRRIADEKRLMSYAASHVRFALWHAARDGRRLAPLER